MRSFVSNALLINILTIIGVLPLFIALDRTPIPWIDEVLWASTSLSVINGHEGKPSVLDAFPDTGRFDLFYGPVGFYLGAFWMKISGVSAWNWRLLSFAGGISIIMLSALIVRALGGSNVLAATGACVVGFSTSLGSSINSGRLDTFTIALELAALYLLLRSMQRRGRDRCSYSVLAGAGIAAAALSTPRALPFCAGLAVGAIALLCHRSQRQVFGAFFPAAIVSSTAVCLWQYSQGLSIVGWLKYLALVAKGDSSNISPVLGGSWGSRNALYLPELGAPIVVALLACCLSWIVVEVHRHTGEWIGCQPELAFLLVVGATNLLLSFALFSRVLNYQLFFMVPVLISLLMLAQLLLMVTPSAITRKVVLASWVGLGVLGLGIRAAKVIELFESWSSRNPKPIEAFITANIPAKSIVLGLDPCYFWAVQDSGSKYLWIEENTTPGLSSHSRLNARTLVTEAARQPIYLVWKRGSVLSPELSALPVRRTASFEAPAIKGLDIFSKIRNRIGSGYPQTDVYIVRVY